jgi:hypothetical protein
MCAEHIKDLSYCTTARAASGRIGAPFDAAPARGMREAGAHAANGNVLQIALQRCKEGVTRYCSLARLEHGISGRTRVSRKLPPAQTRAQRRRCPSDHTHKWARACLSQQQYMLAENESCALKWSALPQQSTSQAPNQGAPCALV